MFFDIHIPKDEFDRGPDDFGVMMRVVAELTSVIKRLVHDISMDDNLRLKVTPYDIYGTTGDPLQGTIRVVLSNRKKTIRVVETDFVIFIGEMTPRFVLRNKLVSIGNIVSRIFPKEVFEDTKTHEHFVLECKLVK